MRTTFRRFVPAAALCLVTLLGGCVVVPGGGYYRPHPHWGWYR